MRKDHWLLSAVMMSAICVGFIGTIACSITYMAKDYNAYNSVYAFFGVDTQLRMALTRLPLDKLHLLRFLNVSHALFTLSAMLFALLFSDLLPQKVVRYIRAFSIALAAVQTVFLDPGSIIWLYMERIGPFADIFIFRGFYKELSAVLCWAARLEILFAVVLLIVAFFRTPYSIRAGAGLVALFFSGISAVYMYLYSWMPAQVLWMSRVADYIGYDSLPIYKPTVFNAYAQKVSILFVICFCLITWYAIRQRSRERRHDMAFRSKVSAVDVVSRVFCHYLKNELLSQQAELKLLAAQITPALKDDVNFIIARNDEIYHRLTAVRETMKQQKIALESMDLSALIRDTFSQMTLPQSVQLTIQMPDEAIPIVGSAFQLRDVLECLARNALEAGGENGVQRICLNGTLLRRYASIVISNDGPRIKREEWDKIFDPFYSTKPSKSNWGLGLALCKNIITLHHGRIWVEEQSIDGKPMTAFHILLPLAR